MQFSIEDLPAPLGPMMARTSPLRISKLMSVSARTPPKLSEMFSTVSNVSVNCLLRMSSARLAQRLGRRPVDDRHVALDHTLAAVLEGHFGADMRRLRAVVERLDQRAVTLGDEAAAHLARARKLAVVGVEQLGQHEEAPDLRTRHLG